MKKSSIRSLILAGLPVLVLMLALSGILSAEPEGKKGWVGKKKTETFPDYPRNSKLDPGYKAQAGGSSSEPSPSPSASPSPSPSPSPSCSPVPTLANVRTLDGSGLPAAAQELAIRKEGEAAGSYRQGRTERATTGSSGWSYTCTKDKLTGQYKCSSCCLEGSVSSDGTLACSLEKTLWDGAELIGECSTGDGPTLTLEQQCKLGNLTCTVGQEECSYEIEIPCDLGYAQCQFDVSGDDNGGPTKCGLKVKFKKCTVTCSFIDGQFAGLSMSCALDY